MKSVYDIIQKPIISEKSMASMQNDKIYAFKVAVDANKIEIKNAVEAIFGVQVEKVTTVNCKGKEKRVGVHTGYTAKSKKAYVKLTESSKTIEFFDGMM
jgi:large subunit ribosomal protein L23